MRGLFAAALASTLLAGIGGILEPARAQAADGGVVALTGARLLDGTGSPPLETSTLLIRNGRVEAVGAPGAVSIPADAEQIDLSGKTILPGFINAHGHLNAERPGMSVRERLAAQLRLYADYGITTVVVLGIGEGDLEPALRLRDEQDSGGLSRARLFVAGPSLQNLALAEDARARVNAYADAGVDIVKIHVTGGPNDMTPAVYGALIDQAHARGLRVAAHVYYLEDAQGLVDAGVDVLAHGVRDQDLDAGMIAEMKRRNVDYVPTLTRDLARFVYETTPEFLSDPFFERAADAYANELAMVRDPARQAEIRASAARQADKAGLAQGRKNLELVSDAGVVIGLGTDSGTNLGQWQGYFEHTELEMMVEAGLSPMQALVAATGGAARAAGLDGELGTLQPGRWADLLVLNADPLEDIRASRQIDSVWMAGRRLVDVP